jgi:glycerol uptake facilitator-like aquaporin
MKNFIVEFLGTFFLCFVAIFALQNGADISSGLAICSIAAVWYSISAHAFQLNPAISIAQWAQSKLHFMEMVRNVLGQCAGATMAAIVSVFLLRHMGDHDVPAVRSDYPATFVLEALGTFLLVIIGLIKQPGLRVHAPSALVYLCCFIAFGKFSILSLNPAFVIGYAVAGLLKTEIIWVHLGATLFAGLAAGSVLVAVFGREELNA